MVDTTETTTTSGGPNRLITFELDEDETLLVRAGRDEMDNRTIFQGSAGGRYAIVPVDELAPASEPGELLGDPRHGDIRIIGQTTSIPETEAGDTVEMRRNSDCIVDFDAKGAYGLLWIPYH